MSRAYHMDIFIENYDSGKSEEIDEAVTEIWNIEGSYKRKEEIHLYGDGNLSGGASEEDFMKEVTIAVFKANEAACDIRIHATYMEDLPYEYHSIEKDSDEAKEILKEIQEE